MNRQAQLASLLDGGTSIIITGGRGAGKSTLAASAADLCRSPVGGVVSIRSGDGYRLDHYPTGEQHLYCTTEAHQLNDPEAVQLTRRFWFSPRVFSWACNRISQDISSGRRIILLDEIGPVELQNRGFYDMIRPDRRNREVTFLLVVREELLEQICSLFQLQHCSIHTVRNDHE